ncbi:Homeodomain-like protein, partial [Basidiobolus meristosporus CBS 931.73]
PHPAEESQCPSAVKPKRKRANATQLKVLNQLFQQTFFPSTELRIQLGKQLGMSPRTVQIWFQNKRQAWRIRNK